MLDLGTVYAAPLAAMLLADFGAEVIKVEHPRGDPARTHGRSRNGCGLWWKVLSRNKRTITLDLATARGRELLADLAARSDVLIENFRPGVLERWQLGPDVLQAVNPRVVILRVTGFGQFGPYAQRRAFGTLAEAMSGFADMTGQPGGPPTLPPFGLADGIAALAGANAVMFALYERDNHSGAGQVIDLSLIEPILTILGPGPSVYDQLGVVGRRQGNRSSNNAPRNTYKTKDGRWVVVSASATSVARRIMRIVGRDDLVDQPWFESARERVRHGDELDGAVAAWIAERDYEHVQQTFVDAGAALAPVYDTADLMADPQIRALDAITTIQDEQLGPLRMQNVMFRMLATPGRIDFAGRCLGQDNEEVYGEILGLDRDEIADLREEGVI